MREHSVAPCALLGASLVLGLAALSRMARPAAADVDPARVIRLPAPVTTTIVTLFALAGVVLAIAAIRRIRRRARRGGEVFDPTAPPPPAWMRKVAQIASLLNVVLIAYLCWRGVIPLADLLALGHGAGSVAPSLPAEPSAAAPLLVTWTFGALALVAGVGALALALWVGFGDRLVEWWLRTADEPPWRPPAVAGEEPIGDPHAEPDPRRAIIRCYGRFERAAADSGLGRRPSHTPTEFMREMLARLPGARAAVPTLTGLFQLARFSGHALGPAERARALGALDELTAAIDERRRDAPTA